jgi:NitT/TauT family transport system substrate-binding protein
MFKKVFAVTLSVMMLLSMVGCTSKTSGEDKITPSGGNDKATVTEGADSSDGVTQAASGELTKVSFRLNYTASGLHSPFYMALEKGYYEEAGLDVTIGEGTGSGTTAKLVGTGSDDLGLVDSASVGSAVAGGIPIKVVCPVYAVNGYGIISLASTGIESPKDLEGKKVGIATGDGPSNLFAAVAAANDVDLDKINFVSMDSNSKITALIKGQVDAILGGADNEAITIKNMGNEVNVLRYSEYGAATVGLSVIASDNFIQNNPEVVKSFISATMKAWNEARGDAEGTVEYILDDFPTMDKNTALGGLQVALDSLFAADSSTLGNLSESDWENCRDLLVNYMGVDESVKATDLYTFDCLPEDLPAK